VPDEEIDKITHLNAMKHFQFDPFSVRPREKCTVGALRAEAADVDTALVSRGHVAERHRQRRSFTTLLDERLIVDMATVSPDRHHAGSASRTD
jgi:hypothetical protein